MFVLKNVSEVNLREFFTCASLSAGNFARKKRVRFSPVAKPTILFETVSISYSLECNDFYKANTWTIFIRMKPSEISHSPKKNPSRLWYFWVLISHTEWKRLGDGEIVELKRRIRFLCCFLKSQKPIEILCPFTSFINQKQISLSHFISFFQFDHNNVLHLKRCLKSWFESDGLKLLVRRIWFHTRTLLK